MLDIKYLKDNLDQVKKALAKKEHLKFELDEVIEAYDNYTEIKQAIDDLRAKQNQISDKISQAGGKPDPAEISKAKQVKESLVKLGKDFEKAEKKYQKLVSQLHNLPDESTPAGKDEKGNKVISKWGEPRQFDFPVKDHMELGKNLGLIDKKRGVKVSGSRFTFLKGQAYQLQFALIKYLEDKLMKKDYSPMIPPVLVKEKAMYGTGFFPAEEGEYYKLEGEDLYLVGTAEVPLASYHADEILDLKEGPLKYMGYSSCFRKEAGNYGQDTKGILRLHQFDKVEMFIYANQENSWDIYENELAKISEEILQDLELPYQKVLMCGGDIGMPNAKKYDFETWMPSQKKYRETMSCSHDTDFQSRRLGIRYRDQNGKVQFAHTMNNTALAMGRTIIAILENFQQKDGSVKIPKKLWKYAGFKKISPEK